MSADDKLAVTQEDAALAEKFWRVHPREIQDSGLTREEWYAEHIARHRARFEAQARLAGERAGKWQDIASAPMNKTHVALLRVNDDGSWTYGHGYYMPLEGWRCWQHHAHKSPTHWHPLPEPPAILKEAASITPEPNHE